MKKPEKKPKPRKRTAIKDLTAKHATKVKGGLNPQPEPPMALDHKLVSQNLITQKITNPLIKLGG